MQTTFRDHLIEELDYDPATGVFTWRHKKRGIRAGSVAGSVNEKGYVLITFSGRRYRAHRLAWLHHFGKWPEFDIDHINGNKSDNRIGNLRDIPHRTNLQNQVRACLGSKTGLLGSSPDKARPGKFVAQINKNGKVIKLGRFDTPEQAHSAYLSAKRKMHAGCTL